MLELVERRGPRLPSQDPLRPRDFDYAAIAAALCEEGATTVSVAKRFGCGRGTVYKVQLAFGLLDPAQSRPRVDPVPKVRRCHACVQLVEGALEVCPHCAEPWRRTYEEWRQVG